MQIDIEKALELLLPEGALSLHLKNFESRPQQAEMMRAVLDAYNQNQLALIEAGTGTGKSLAYLLPAVAWAMQNQQKTVISTNTIALQEQLLEKDFPLIKKILNVDLKAILVKGMGNYLCKRKLSEALHEIGGLEARESEELRKIEAWSENTKDGSRASLPIVPSKGTWEKVCAESDTCNRKECPFFQDCHFIQARKEVEDAQILIVNHSLLFADLVMKLADPGNEQTLLPEYTRVIFDEAHEVEETATQFFAGRISQHHLMKTIGRIGSEKHGKLPALGKVLSKHLNQIPEKEMMEISNLLSIDIPGHRRALLQQIVDTFNAYEEFLYSIGNLMPEERFRKLRLLPSLQKHPHWTEEIVPATKELISTIEQYSGSLAQLNQQIQRLDNSKIKEQTQGIRYEITALSNRLLEAARLLMNFLKTESSTNQVRWIEAENTYEAANVTLFDAPLDISEPLVEALFKRISTAILCSATLTTNKTFQFIRQRLGLTKDKLISRVVTEQIFHSPFDYQKQVLFAVPIDLPNPSEALYTSTVGEKIWEAIQASRGNAFVLFTSYQMMKNCYEILKERLQKHRYPVMKQGDASRGVLLERFKTTEYSVLFGTDSFWQGIDVVGDALRCVIITKLPFKVPTEPLIQARTEAILEAGGDPFMEYSIPTAIVRFKQGFGRLIRNKKDRGCIVCLDPRLVRKPYGKLFINSLPACEQIFPEGGALKEKMSAFYRKTHAMTK